VTAQARILVVDDDEAILDSLRRALELEGLDVAVAADGTAALQAVRTDGPDAIVLDVGLPDINGRIVAARIRAAGLATPILILSALDQIDERVAGLEAGADDYLVKPFAMDELVARLRALLRRAAVLERASDDAAAEAPLRVGSLLVDVGAWSASWDGRDLGLTRRELALLEALARNVDVVLSRDRLLEIVWGYDFAPTTKVVDVFVSYLRRKLADAGAPRVIETVRGVGFVLRRA
jgi:DNA-binding response OmpR family regulator